MKALMKIFVIWISLSGLAYSMECPDTPSSLSSDVRDLLRKQCEMLNAQMKVGVSENLPSVENASAWAEVSKNFASAIGIAAKEVGASVNEFVQTPVGKMTALIVVWKMLGADLLKIFSIPVVLLSLAYLLRRIWQVGTTTVPRSFWLFKWTKEVPKYSSWNNLEDSGAMMTFVLLVVGVIYTGVVIGNL